jgi:hypothetical protein
MQNQKTIIGGTDGDPNFPKSYHWKVGVATIGVEQRTFRTTGMGCVGECEPIGISKKTIIGDMHGGSKFQK